MFSNSPPANRRRADAQHPPAHLGHDPVVLLPGLGIGRHQRVRYEKHCPLHGKLEAHEIVKGFQYAPDQYVVIEPEDLEAIRPVKDKALTLEQFVDPADVDAVRFSGRTLHLLPDGIAAHRP